MPDDKQQTLIPHVEEPKGLAVNTDLDMGALVAQAIDKGPDGVASLERLVALMEREEQKQARRAFFAALARFQRERPRITKNREVFNKGGHKMYGYAELNHIVTTIQPTLIECGLSFTHDGEVQENGAVRTTCIVSHEDGHSESATFECLPPDRTAIPLAPGQKTQHASTTGRRCSLIMALGLTDCEDDEDENGPLFGVEPITADEALKLEAKATEIGEALAESKGRDPDEVANRRLNWAGVTSFEEFPSDKYGDAFAMLAGIKV